MTRPHARALIGSLLIAAGALLAGCEELVSEGDAELQGALHEALPDLASFELVEIDDRQILETLAEHASGSDGTTPIYVVLPVIDADGTVIEDFRWTVYAHDLRRFDEERGGTPVYGVSDPDANVEYGPLLDVLVGPSLTFQGVPRLSREAFSLLLDETAQGEFPYPESQYQMSVLNILGGASSGELEGAYYGPELQAPSVIQGVRSLLSGTLEPAAIDSLLANSRANYVIYNHADYQPGLDHIDEDWAPAASATTADDPHGAETTAPTLAPQAHAFEDGWRTINLVPVADDTVYDPDTGTWAIDDWFARMEAAVNRMDLFGVFTNIHADHGGDSLPNNNRFMLRTTIPEYRVLTETGKDRLVPHPATGCGGAGSYRDEIRKLSGGTERYENEYWLWSTQDDFSGGGCSYTQVIDLSPRGGTQCDQIDNRSYGACGSVGYIELRSGHTQDWTSLVVIHEAGHALNGRHDDDAFGSTGQSDNSQRCSFLGIVDFGPTGQSIMSYASGTTTWCFAWTPADGTPVRNTSLMGNWLHGVLDPPP